jgi:hypothetical protein
MPAEKIVRFNLPEPEQNELPKDYDSMVAYLQVAFKQKSLVA